ncbi:serine hydrolase domain-containing protein [Achromobacter sp. NPDC058515]|uniref:serine hydrolase domain-containing protein n=1 Tax=Achromobacter sp. NPDC058515 TaxID=3346533 RepID=UPI0036555620
MSEASIHQAGGAAGVAIHGHCDPIFEPVREAFARNFQDAGELGAAVAVEIDGRPAIDLWAGWADAERRRPWERDTVCIVFSNTKPATALCAHMLAEAGELDLDAPVARYWPEFAAAGKGGVTARMLLNHTAGLPALREPLPADAAFDWDGMTDRLARAAPFWAPGSRVAYHGLTYGWLVGELVRRLGGCMPGEFFRRHVAQPLALDFWIGLPASVEARVAPIVPPAAPQAPLSPFERSLQDEPDSPTALYARNTGGWRPAGFNSRAGHAAGLCAAGGIGNARSLARLYGTLAAGGARDGVRLLREDTLAAATALSAQTGDDACLRVPTRFASGFMRQMDNRARGLDSACFGAQAFGHTGAGGSLAFAWPERRLAFAYTMNRLGRSVLLDDRAHRLVQAVHAAIGAPPPS